MEEVTFNLWSTRARALQALGAGLRPEALLLDDIFRNLDETTTRLADIVDPFARASSLCVAKGRHLALASYSLSLDALAQEAGAVLRPMLETINMLVYLRKPANLTKVLEGRAPSSGNVAAAVDAPLRDLRNHLSEHASHFGLAWDEVRHIVDARTGEVRTNLPFHESVLRTNLRNLTLVMVHLLGEALVNLDQAGGDVNDIARDGEACRQRALAMPP